MTLAADPEPFEYRYWPRPWTYDETGFNEGPCIKDANGQVICAFFWPIHPPEATQIAEASVRWLGRFVTLVCNDRGHRP